MKTLFLAWQSPRSGSWFPIGRLTFNGKEYQFNYTNGVLEAKLKCGFLPLPSFPDFNKVYTSQKLFSLFSNRVMARSRPEYHEFLQWLNIPEHEHYPIALLARSGGKRVTDKFEVFPCPEPDDNRRYCIHFFADGLRYLSKSAIERINRLQVGELLYLAHEFQNSHASRVLLCTKDHWIVGYCQRYLVDDIFELISQHPELVGVEVDRLNQAPTPLQFRLLCKITVDCPIDFRPFSSPIYQAVSSDVLAESAIG
ncbi:DNA-binding protein [Microcoleus sp. BR0-C5]|uniref:DNA-binding protein n=1 Tax=Microcoleus sp. BR0-C5 TaxID=2818713 RepID=UPI002FD683C2